MWPPSLLPAGTSIVSRRHPNRTLNLSSLEQASRQSPDQRCIANEQVEELVAWPQDQTAPRNDDMATTIDPLLSLWQSATRAEALWARTVCFSMAIDGHSNRRRFRKDVLVRALERIGLIFRMIPQTRIALVKEFWSITNEMLLTEKCLLAV